MHPIKEIATRQIVNCIVQMEYFTDHEIHVGAGVKPDFSNVFKSVEKVTGLSQSVKKELSDEVSLGGNSYAVFSTVMQRHILGCATRLASHHQKQQPDRMKTKPTMESAESTEARLVEGIKDLLLVLERANNPEAPRYMVTNDMKLAANVVRARLGAFETSIS